MLWLSSPPWGRWVLATLLAITAVWVELRPDPTVDHLFAIVPIAPGEAVGPSNTETRRVPMGLFAPIDPDVVATRPIDAGEPLLTSSVGRETEAIPTGWWVVSAQVPIGARPGAPVRVVLLDTGAIVDGVMATPVPDDPLGSGEAGIAVPPDDAGEVAVAAAEGRIAVLISAG